MLPLFKGLTQVFTLDRWELMNAQSERFGEAWDVTWPDHLTKVYQSEPFVVVHLKATHLSKQHQHTQNETIKQVWTNYHLRTISSLLNFQVWPTKLAIKSYFNGEKVIK